MIELPAGCNSDQHSMSSLHAALVDIDMLVAHPLNWEAIQHPQEGVVRKSYEHYTFLNVFWETSVAYKPPFFGPNLEEDYRMAWGIFEKESA